MNNKEVDEIIMRLSHVPVSEWGGSAGAFTWESFSILRLLGNYSLYFDDIQVAEGRIVQKLYDFLEHEQKVLATNNALNVLRRERR